MKDNLEESVDMGKMRITSKSSGSCRPPPFLRNPRRTGFASTTFSFPSTLLGNLITVGTILSCEGYENPARLFDHNWDFDGNK